MKITFPFRFTNLKKILENPLENPKDFLYGADQVLTSHSEVDYYLEPRGQRNTLLKKALYYFERPFSRRTNLGMSHEVVLCHRNKFKLTEKVVCINDAISFAFLFWRMFGLVRADVYTLFQSLPERHLKYFSHRPIFKFLIRQLLKQSRHVMVLSSAAKYELHRVFHVPLDKITVFFFGADISFWRYEKYHVDKRNYILSVGNDMNRDYKTLVDACRDRYDLVIVSNSLQGELSAQNSNGFKSCLKKQVKKIVGYTRNTKIDCNEVEILSNVTNEELRDLYHRAKLVVTPSCKVLTESSGLSTTVQAMSCGTPVLISDSLPLREMFTEHEHISYFEPENGEDLQRKLELLWDDAEVLETMSENARNIIEERYNTVAMGKQLEDVLSD